MSDHVTRCGRAVCEYKVCHIGCPKCHPPTRVGYHFCRICGAALSDARQALGLTLCSGPCHIAAQHAWIWDEGSNGIPSRWCTKCHQFFDDVQPNEYHGMLPCRRAPR